MENRDSPTEADAVVDVGEFRERIEEFLRTHRMSPTKFGAEFASDPGFVFQLRKGREPRASTRIAVIEAMSVSEAAE